MASSTGSSKVEVFEIEFDRDPAVFREGDTVTGRVSLLLNEQLKLRSEYHSTVLLLHCACVFVSVSSYADWR